MLCGANKLGLFARVDTGSGTAKAFIAAHAHFDEHQCFFVIQDQVDLTGAAAVILREEF